MKVSSEGNAKEIIGIIITIAVARGLLLGLDIIDLGKVEPEVLYSAEIPGKSLEELKANDNPFLR